MEYIASIERVISEECEAIRCEARYDFYHIQSTGSDSHPYCIRFLFNEKLFRAPWRRLQEEASDRERVRKLLTFAPGNFADRGESWHLQRIREEFEEMKREAAEERRKDNFIFENESFIVHIERFNSEPAVQRFTASSTQCTPLHCFWNP